MKKLLLLLLLSYSTFGQQAVQPGNDGTNPHPLLTDTTGRPILGAGTQAIGTVTLAAAGANGANPCANPNANLQSVSFTTSGTTAVQQIAISGTTKVYGCALNVIGQSGTTPTFSLVFGTGTNCAVGQGTLVPAFATPANTLFPFVSPVFVTTAGQAVCYLDTGTTPVQVVTLTYVQQ